MESYGGKGVGGGIRMCVDSKGGILKGSIDFNHFTSYSG